MWHTWSSQQMAADGVRGSAAGQAPCGSAPPRRPGGAVVKAVGGALTSCGGPRKHALKLRRWGSLRKLLKRLTKALDAGKTSISYCLWNPAGSRAVRPRGTAREGRAGLVWQRELGGNSGSPQQRDISGLDRNVARRGDPESNATTTQNLLGVFS